MKFAAVFEYLQDPEKVAAIRPLHRQYLSSLLEKDQLVAAGPLTDDTGALIVYEAESAEAVEQLIRADPFFANGIFLRWKLLPWKPVFANSRLLPLS